MSSNNNNDNNEDEILEQAYKYKLLDEDRCSNGIFHRNKNNNSQRKNDSLKEYFFREVEKLEFPDSNMDNLGQENVEELADFELDDENLKNVAGGGCYMLCPQEAISLPFNEEK